MEYGLIGEKLKHSFSKQIHESVGKYPYELVELTSSDLDMFFSRREFKGINVTIPFKEEVIKYLDELDISASHVKAVNCIINKNNKLIGYNTDTYGFKKEIEYLNVDVKNKNALILGTGGASKAVEASLKELGIKNIYFASRNLKGDNIISYQDIKNLKDINILVNTTPRGMYPHNEDDLLVNLDDLPLLEVVIDLIYNPIRTKLIIEAEKRNIKALGGLYMLVGQAYKAMELFIDKSFSDKEITKTYLDLFIKNKNIVLIGMPSSGKSTIANMLNSKINKNVIDIDQEIVNKTHMEIKDIFTKFGENYFRKLEKEVVKDIYKNSGYIISTGGGVIKDKDNIDMLKQNGTIYFINRDIDNLAVTSSRPLSNTSFKLKELYDDRLPLYKRYADIEIDNNKDINEVIKEILKKEGNDL